MSDNIRIHTLLPVYKKDEPEYLRLSVRSILQQTYRQVALYIGVDGPIGEDLEACLAEFGKCEAVSIVRFPENRGLACVLNDLLKIAFDNKAEYIARMDADDISMPERFQKQLRFLQEHPDIDVVGGAIEEIDENGASRNKTVVYPQTPEQCRAFFAKRNPAAHPAVMFRKRLFEKIGGMYRPEYRQNQDTLLWYDGFSHNMQMANIPDTVLKFRMTDSLFKRRRNGFSFAKKQLKDRMMINRELGYGASAYVFALAMFLLMLSPAFIRKIAYRIFR